MYRYEEEARPAKDRRLEEGQEQPFHSQHTGSTAWPHLRLVAPDSLPIENTETSTLLSGH